MPSSVAPPSPVYKDAKLGLILLPLLLTMLCGFGWLGLGTGLRAMAGMPVVLRVLALAGLLLPACALAGVVMLAAFGIVAHGRVSAVLLLAVLMLAHAGGLGTAGMVLRARFGTSGKQGDGALASIFLLAAALFPLTWFGFAERLAARFHVTWQY